nr:Putative amidotransferase [uncultured bacterium]
MKVVILAFDRFTDIDVFLPWDLLNRVGKYTKGEWQVQIAATTSHITSVAGLTIPTHADLTALSDADAVLIASGAGLQGLLKESELLEAVRNLNPDTQLLASMCSGSLLLASAGHLTGKRATSYYTREKQLRSYGVEFVSEPFVLAGPQIATAAGCMASLDLCHWLISSLLTEELAQKVLREVAPNR